MGEVQKKKFSNASDRNKLEVKACRFSRDFLEQLGYFDLNDV